MKSKYMEKHFRKIYEQREGMKKEIRSFEGEEWKRPYQDKWSIGETYYHLFLMIKWFRRLNKIYLPLSKPIAAVIKDKTYKTQSEDVYKQYKEKHHKPMKAPFIIVPPKGIKDEITFGNLLKKIDEETKSLELMVSNISEDIAGQIRFPDPIAHNPNLIQSIDLIGIHENHHFLICKKYYKIN
ncbi:DinB family protein [Bacillus xiapuensis]|uniref:DinB family protein n=1 Tax=Bacillus xiapuensis TaxID=2014075 RepID=UPI0038B7381C